MLRKELKLGQCWEYVKPLDKNLEGPVVVGHKSLGLPEGWRNIFPEDLNIAGRWHLQNVDWGKQEVKLIPHYKEPNLRRCDLMEGDCFVWNYDRMDKISRESKRSVYGDSSVVVRTVALPPECTGNWNISNYYAKADKAPVIRIPRWDQNELVIPVNLDAEVAAVFELKMQRDERMHWYEDAMRNETREKMSPHFVRLPAGLAIFVGNKIVLKPEELKKVQVEWSMAVREKSKLVRNKERLQVVVDQEDE